MFVDTQLEEANIALAILLPSGRKDLTEKCEIIVNELIELKELFDNWSLGDKSHWIKRQYRKGKMSLKFANKVQRFHRKYKPMSKEINNYLGDY